MNGFILAVCVNLLTLVNAVQDISFATILEPKQADNSDIEETNDQVEAIPVTAGYYFQKPKDLAKSLIENPKAWSGDVLDILRSRPTRQSKTNNNAKAKNRGTRNIYKNNYLNGKILKAVRNLNKYREGQKVKTNKKNKFKKYRASGYYRKDPVIKMLGRMFRGLKDQINFRGAKMKKPQSASEPSDAKVLGHLLKKLLVKSTHKKKHAYRYHEPEEQSQEDENFLENIVNDVQNNKQFLEDQGNQKPRRRPTMIIVSTEPLHNNELEIQNNAQESTDEFDEKYDDSDTLNQYQTRRSKGKVDIGDYNDDSSSASDSQSSSYERNPGNPFTVHKNKYKQNWPYNHNMDGDHMNINPMGPQFGSMGPTGPELFFGRKWWYFNQDDFKPMG